MANPWKILGIGCIVLVILIVGVAGVGVFFAVKLGRGVMEQAQQAQLALTELNIKYPFASGTETLPSAERFDQWLTATREAGQSLEASGAAFEKRMEEAADKGFFEAVGTMGGIGDMITSMFSALAEALEGQQMGYEEYRWYAATAHATLNNLSPTTGSLAAVAQVVRAQSDPDMPAPPAAQLTNAQLETMSSILTNAAENHPDLASLLSGSLNFLNMIDQTDFTSNLPGADSQPTTSTVESSSPLGAGVTPVGSPLPATGA